MGVAGLWQLLDPTGRPVRLETLEGKILAIDISIWLNQLVKGYRASGGVALDNAYLVGLFQRGCKLLHFKIRPVFVFDGEAPALKYQTLATRKRRREDGDEAIRAATKKMLQTYVQQKLLGEANPKLPKLKPSRRAQADQELFRLPEAASNLSNSDDDSSQSDSAVDIARDADLSTIKVDSEAFKSLPAPLQHEFLVALKEREKRGAVDVDELPADSDDFSTYQMSQVLKKNKLQSRIEEMKQQMNDGTLRMASDAGVKVVLKVTPRPVTAEVKEEEDDDGGESPSKKAKLEQESDGELAEPSHESTKEKRVENFLVSQWLEGAQRGEESNETLKKAVELVRDEVDVISDSGASSDEAEAVAPVSEMRKRLLSTGGKVSAEEALQQQRRQDGKRSGRKSLDRFPSATASADASRDSVLSDGLSMEVGHGSIVSACTSRVMLPEERFDEGSRTGMASNSDDGGNDEDRVNGDGPAKLQGPADDSNTGQTCNTDMLNADLEVSETANSVFRIEDAAGDGSRSRDEEEAVGGSAHSSQSCKLTEVKGSPVIKEVSFLGGTQSSLNSNDDIVLPQNLSRNASKDPSRCNSNSLGFIPGSLAAGAAAGGSGLGGSSALADNPTDFHQALEIIREQERRQSECAAEGSDHEVQADSGRPSAMDGIKDEVKDPVDEAVPSGEVEAKSSIESNNNVELKETGEKTAQTEDGPEAADGEKAEEPLANGIAGEGLTETAEGEAVQGKDEAEVKQEPQKSPVAGTHYADLVSPEVLARQKQQLETQSLALQNEINRIQRQTAEVTSSMADNCADLLRMFGIPCVRAPREAEAQCAALEHAGLVQGVVTDDSDIFLFGGQTVYKNLFSQNANCEMFTAKTIETRLKLGRADLIGFAMLTGSDYTNGVENVGPVTACEILSEFRSESSQDVLGALKKFKEWWALAQKGAVPPKNSVRTRFIRLTLDDKFPSEVVFNAYEKPTVDVMKEKFTWSRPDLDLLRQFATKTFNWPQEKTDSYLLPILKKYEDRSAQPRIDGFLLPSIQKRENLFPSKRLKAAVGKIKGPPTKPQAEANLSEESSSDECD